MSGVAEFRETVETYGHDVSIFLQREWEKAVHPYVGSGEEAAFLQDFPDTDVERGSNEEMHYRLKVAGVQAEVRVMIEESLVMESGKIFCKHVRDLRFERSGNTSLRPASLAIPRDAIIEKIQQKMQQLGMSKIAARSLYRTCMAMMGTSEHVYELRQKCENDNTLYKDCFGASPKNDVEAIQGPFSLHFRCRTMEDFIRAYQTSRRMPFFGQREKKQTANLHGFAHPIGVDLNEPPKHYITAEHDWRRAPFARNFHLFVHEGSHVLGGFTSRVAHDWNRRDDLSLEELIRECRIAVCDSVAAEEAVAQFVEGKRKSEIVFILGMSPTYDFPKILRQPFLSRLHLCGSKKEEVQNIVKKVLVDEYGKTVVEGIDALFLLRELGMQRAHVQALLWELPLHQWPSFAAEMQRSGLPPGTPIRSDFLKGTPQPA